MVKMTGTNHRLGFFMLFLAEKHLVSDQKAQQYQQDTDKYTVNKHHYRHSQRNAK